MKNKRIWLFLSLFPFLAGCNNKVLITHTVEELSAAVKKLDYSVTHTGIHFESDGHVCGIEAPDEEDYINGLEHAAEQKYPYGENDSAAQKEWKDKKREEFIEKSKFVISPKGAQKTNSLFLSVPLRLYENDNTEDENHDLFSTYQHQTLLDKIVQDEHNGGKVFDVMQSEITDDGIRFFCENNYKVTTIYRIDLNMGNILARGRFNISYQYDKYGYLVTESIKTVELNAPKERVIDFTVRYSYE